MGCGSSNARVKPKKKTENQEEENEEEDDITPVELFRGISTIDSIKCPSGIVPIACFEEYAFPIVLSNLNFHDNQSVGIRLPIIATYETELSRIMCFGHIQMFSTLLGSTKNSMALFSQVIRYLNFDESYMAQVLLLNIDKKYEVELTNQLTSLNCCVSRGTPTSLTKYNLIIIPSDLELTDTLMEALKQYIEGGGAIACFYSPSKTNFSDYSFPPINKFLSLYGLSFLNFPLNTDSFVPENVEILHDINFLLQFQFPTLIELYIRILQEDHFSISDLDELSLTLKYYISAIGSNYTDLLFLLYNISISYLIQNGYQTELGICPKVNQSIVAVIIEELLQHLPFDKIGIFFDSYSFPGLSKNKPKFPSFNSIYNSKSFLSMGNSSNNSTFHLSSFNNSTTSLSQSPSKLNQKKLNSRESSTDFFHLNSNTNLVSEPHLILSSFKSSISLYREAMISTGFWVPPGIIATVKFSTLITGCCLQIGTHTSQLFSNSPPWHRWPNVISSFPISQTEMKIASPFGGILYIVTPPDFLQTVIQIEIENVSQYPRYIKSKPKLYYQTKDINVPWGEIECKNVIITLPSEEMRKVNDFVPFIDTIDKIIDRILVLESYALFRPYRVCFDVDLVKGSLSNYPIPILMKYASSLLTEYSKPNPALWNFVVMIAIMSLRDEYFDQETEKALGSYIAALIFTEFFPGFNPMQLCDVDLPPIFDELWYIHENIDQKVIIQLLCNSQNPKIEGQNELEDRWNMFVYEVCQLSHKNLSLILQKARKLPARITDSIAAFPIPNADAFLNSNNLNQSIKVDRHELNPITDDEKF